MKAVVVLLVMSVALFSQGKPSMDETKKFIEYYASGKDAVLFDAKVTSKVEDRMPVDEITETKAGSVVSLWVKFMIPKNATDNKYKAVFKFGDTVLKTKQFDLVGGDFGSMGYRSWSSKGLHNKGEHVIEITHGEEVVKSFKVMVN